MLRRATALKRICDRQRVQNATRGKYLFKTEIALVNTPEYLGPDHVFVCGIPLPLLGTVVSSISSHYIQF